MSALLSISVDTTFGAFVLGEQVISGTAISTVRGINPEAKTISVDPPIFGTFAPGATILGSTSLTVGVVNNSSTINALDLFSIFGNQIPLDFSFTDYVTKLTSIEPEKYFTLSQDLETAIKDVGESFGSNLATPEVYTNPSANSSIDPYLTQTRTNPLNPKATPGEATPNNVENTPVANEPTYEFNARYPYNKVFVSESGHTKEIDDTPGYERLLDRHASGTYNEMQYDGNMITKVVSDKYTVVCGDDYISIEGHANIIVRGNCNLSVGGYINAEADKGINMNTKGDFRLKAKSINMETTGGNITAKSSASTLLTATEKTDIKSKSHHIDSTEITSISVGQQFIVDAQKISQRSKSSIDIVSDAATSIKSTGATNIKSGAAVNVEGSGNISLKGSKVLSSEIESSKLSTTTLVSPSPSGVATVAAPASATDAVADAPIPAEESKGSGILFMTDVDNMSMATDDDPEGRIIALKHGIETGCISQEQLDAEPDETGESDDSPPQDVSGAPSTNGGSRAMVLTRPTIGNVGQNPADNLRLSTHFQLMNLSSRTPVSKTRITGPRSQEYVNNLQILAQNCLEPIKKRYPNMFVSSGFRSSSKSSTSQHLVGQAADMQFSGTAKSEYYAIAQWIKDNCPYDQLILEYKDRGTGLPWIHISCKASGNRNEVMTFHEDKKRCDGLRNLAR
jgi:hypothetical protein